jgi:cellulose synthase operon protein C
VALVRTYVQGGRQDEAERFLESILEVDSDNVTAHMLLGELSYANEQIPAAIAHFSAVIKADPQLVAGYRRLAVVYSSQREIDKAIAVIEQGMEAIPDNPLLNIHMAAIHEKYRNVDDAIDIYQAMVDKDDKAVVAKNNLANLLTEYRTDQASLDRARKIATDLRDSQIPQFRDTYAWASVKSGINLEEAIVILEGIVREYEKVDIYAYHLGEAYRRKGDTANAISYLQKAIKLAPPGSDISTRAQQALEQVL